MKIKCPECGYEFELDPETIRTTPYIQCQDPNCLCITKNEHYEG